MICRNLGINSLKILYYCIVLPQGTVAKLLHQDTAVSLKRFANHNTMKLVMAENGSGTSSAHAATVSYNNTIENTTNKEGLKSRGKCNPLVSAKGIRVELMMLWLREQTTVIVKEVHVLQPSPHSYAPRYANRDMLCHFVLLF